MHFFLDTSEDASVAIMLEGYGSQLVFTEKHSAETVDNERGQKNSEIHDICQFGGGVSILLEIVTIAVRSLCVTTISLP